MTPAFDVHRGVDIQALMKALPVSGLDRHQQDVCKIDVALHDALEFEVVVELYQWEGWQPVDQIARLQRREPLLECELPK